MHVADLGEIARLVSGELIGPADVEVCGPATLEDAGPQHITFAAEPRYFQKAKATRAAAVLVPRDAPDLGVPMIRVAHPRLAWVQVLEYFAPAVTHPEGVHPTAVLGVDVKVGRGASIGAHVWIGDGAVVGDGAVIEAGCVIGEGVTIGPGSHLYPRVTLYPGVKIGRNVIIHAGSVVGSDGFGYVTVGRKHRKVPHLGDVVIEDDVEIGALVSIDRGVTGSTVIGRGTKIDNLVQIGHNVKIGADCMIVSQTGIAGSARIGDRVTLAGQSGVAGHLSIGEESVVAARGVVVGDLPAGSFVSGMPARPHREQMRIIALTHRLPQMSETVAELERQVQALQERLRRLEEELPAGGDAR